MLCFNVSIQHYLLYTVSMPSCWPQLYYNGDRNVEQVCCFIARLYLDMSQWISANIICCCLVFDFFRSRVVIRFFIPATTANDLRLQRIFYSRCYPLHCIFSYLNSSERASINVEWQTRNYWYHFYYVFGMTRSLSGDWTRDLLALEASTLPLGYRGGGVVISVLCQSFIRSNWKDTI